MLGVLYNIIIAPIEMIIEAIFCVVLCASSTSNVVWAIVAVSLAVSILTLPIYNVADAIQKREREKQSSMAHWVKHIREHFTGDERFMMLQAYYRICHYHPLHAFRSSLSIVFQVPFFMAAYHFLSNCPALQGASCGVLRDLGKADALVVLPFSLTSGGLTLNLLPILMTAINAVSAAVYLKGFTLREKVQTYSLALIFLVLLYNSPSGLVLYWTLNNVFSLAKNVVIAIKNKCAANSTRGWWGVTCRRQVSPADNRKETASKIASASSSQAMLAGDGISALWQTAVHSPKVLAVHLALSLALAAAMFALIVLRVLTYGTTGKFRTALFMLSIIWASLPYTWRAYKGEIKAYKAHVLISLVMVLSFVSLCAARLVAHGNPGKFRTACLIFSFAWMALPIEKRAIEGDKDAIKKHLAVSGALCLWALFICVTGMIAYKSVGRFREILLALSVLWMASIFFMATVFRFALKAGGKADAALFLTSAAGLALLLGLVLPSSAIATDTGAFCFVGDIDSPLYYVIRALSVFSGLFVLWPSVIYKMFGQKVKSALPLLTAFLFVMALLNVYVFGFNYGTVERTFKLDHPDVLHNGQAFFVFCPIVAMFAACVLLLFIKCRKWTKYAAVFMMAICIAECALGVNKSLNINREYLKRETNLAKAVIPNRDYLPYKYETRSDIHPVYHLSKTGKNVVILFLDCAVNSFLPYFIKEKPSLNESLSGFVYYPNTVSFSSYTYKATGAMMGGYEYTPEAMNERPDERINDKQNEAAAMLPRIFSEAGWQATITDPPFVGGGKASCGADVFDPYNVKFLRVSSMYEKVYLSEHPEIRDVVGREYKDVAKHITMFSLMQSALPIFRAAIYNDRRGYKGKRGNSTLYYFTFSGEHLISLGAYSHMYYLNEATDFTADKNTFTFIDTDVAHQPELKALPDYTIAVGLDVTKATTGFYKPMMTPRGTFDYVSDVTHYHSSMAAVLLSAKWFDYLKENGVYDNTRIIIVSDHVRQMPLRAFESMERGWDYACLNPMLMMKDFNASGPVRTDNTFMTNADSPLLAKQGLGLTDINPFTGKSLTKMADKSEVRIYPLTNFPACLSNVRTARLWELHNLHPIPAYAVHDNIFDEKNWRRLDDDEEASK